MMSGVDLAPVYSLSADRCVSYTAAICLSGGNCGQVEMVSCRRLGSRLYRWIDLELRNELLLHVPQ